jgi:small subunit ribosomal protein S6
MDIKPKRFKNEYETTFILNPELSEDERKTTVDKFVQLIQSNDGEIQNTEDWGLRKLAYSVKAKSNGYYTFLEFTAYSELIAKLEQAYRYDERVLRYLTVTLDKHAVAYNKKRRENNFGLRKK